ncbi:MAG: response regulator transcription factor [Butyricicoccus sp.]|nr:response regulator transcription factor [Butyricicoccus sp.]
MFQVLLVDNESSILGGLQLAIDWAAQDCAICGTACNGLDALQKISVLHPDIVITDIRMPEMDGLTLAQRIREDYPNTQVILLTGFPDFEYAQRAIQYQVADFVLKPTTEDQLIHALQNARSRIDIHLRAARADHAATDSLQLRRNIMLQNLLYGTAPSLLYTMNHLHELPLDLSAYYVIRCGIQPEPGAENPLDLIEHACHLVQEQLSEYPSYPVAYSDRYAYLVLCAPASFQPLAACLNAIRQTDLNGSYTLTIGISQHQTDPAAMQHAAREADNAQQFAEVDGQFAAFLFENLPTPEKEVFTQLDEQIALVRTALENNNRSGVQQYYAALCAQTRKKKLSLTAVRRILSFLHTCGQELLYQHCVDVLLSSAPDTMPAETSLDELERSVYDSLMHVLDAIEATGADMDSLILGVKNYIDQHYQENLSLELLAEQAHLSSSYLSKLFKKEIGQNLSSYIHQVRIERAKTLLRTSNLKTYEIAEAVGISDPVYFSRLFKKATGCKPKDYRVVK